MQINVSSNDHMIQIFYLIFYLLAKFVAFINFTKSLFSLILFLKWDVLSVDLAVVLSFDKEVFLGVWDEGDMDGGRINWGGEFRCNIGDSFELF